MLKNTWLQEAIDYWKDLIDEEDIGTDWADAHNHCWRCGKTVKNLQRCHIKPKSRGGGLEPSNVVALCPRCHDEMPNVVDDSGAVWDWIKRDHAEYYDSFWKEKALKAVGLEWQDLDLNKLLKNMDRTELHFGQLHGGAFISQGTLEWLFLNSQKDSDSEAEDGLEELPSPPPSIPINPVQLGFF